MYVGDMAGQLWRFDIWNGKPASSLVTGGVIASLGAKEDPAHPEAARRRFYAAADVAGVQKAGIDPFFNIAIGSGWRGHPLNGDVEDRFYSIRDYNPFTALTQTAFNALYSQTNPKTDSESTLIDITTNMQPTIPSGALGWKIALNQHGGWVGEKVLVASTTFNNQVIFTTYTPNTGAVAGDPCRGVGTGTNRVYIVRIVDGAPTIDRNRNGDLDASDRSADLSQGGIAPRTAFLFPAKEVSDGSGSDDDGQDGDGNGSDGRGSGPVTCLSGVEVLSVCTNFNQRIKTYWREGSAN
jgi:type IV pilus assembly protein PilY1